MKILQRTIFQSKLLEISSVSRLSTTSTLRHGLNTNNEFTQIGSFLKKSEIIPSSHQLLLVPNFLNQFLLNSRRFSTSRLGLNEEKSDKSDEYIHMYHKTKGFVGYHTPKPKKWKKHKEKDNDMVVVLAISVIGGFALYSIGGRSARAE